MRKRKGFKLSVITLLTVFLLAIGASSASAAAGWGDTFETAEVMYRANIQESSFYSATVPLDGSWDSDFYVVDNIWGSSTFSFYVIATPPPAFDLVLFVYKMNANDNILSIEAIDYNGKGIAESGGFGINPGEKIYFRVMDNGISDYSKPYTIEFRKTS
ncbi:hypothetical protein [Paenibacillus lutimineralis]|uniref:Uncharacterized protein n=1 Tax=Paenibacillus lutimineralis TaxID=2707005 RepID=A0A3Q9I9R9_9BACL|nr:hypothetical protein [Paenibacillus lutimineralis]AZS14366.1 hypothetical protein EI981_07790 [Paenibacillus lutimineralis]